MQMDKRKCIKAEEEETCGREKHLITIKLQIQAVGVDQHLNVTTLIEAPKKKSVIFCSICAVVDKISGRTNAAKSDAFTVCVSSTF